MKIYKGTPPISAAGETEAAGACLVEVIGGGSDTGDPNCYLLPPRNDLRDHSPDGFQWGYGGSGPAQLALAILADCYMDDELANKLHQEFKRAVVAGLPQGEPWELTEWRVRKVVSQLRGEV